MKNLLIILAVVLLIGGVVGYELGRTRVAEVNTTAGPGSVGTSKGVVLASGPINGKIQSVSGNFLTGSIITLDTGWSIAVNSGTVMQYPSGMKLSIQDLKPGMQFSAILKKTQAPGRVSADALSSILIAPPVPSAIAAPAPAVKTIPPPTTAPVAPSPLAPTPTSTSTPVPAR